MVHPKLPPKVTRPSHCAHSPLLVWPHSAGWRPMFGLLAISVFVMALTLSVASAQEDPGSTGNVEVDAGVPVPAIDASDDPPTEPTPPCSTDWDPSSSASLS